MRVTGMLTVVLLCSCGGSKSPIGPQMREDGGAAAACESIAETGAAHYEKAAEEERIAEAMRAEFVEANLHMLMVDCRAHPSTVIPCVAAAGSAAQIEEQCLSPLDEAGDVEGKYFSRK